MNWDKYKKTFIKAALDSGHDNVYIEKHLTVAYNLYKKDLPIIYDHKHLSYLVGYTPEYLLKASNSPKNFYRYYKISKKNGGYRNIAEPLPNLKAIQRWILEEILYSCKTSEFAKAYKKNISLRDNAKFHRNQKKVLTIDIENFFGMIKREDINIFFVSLGYPKEVSTILTNLCTLKGSLPQGAITSPALSNIVMKEIDKRISSFSLKNKIRYTRYADDLTFSGDFNPGKVIKFVSNVLNSKGFKLNPKKTRVRLPHQSQEVTGIIVNEKMQVSRKARNELRKNIYYIKKYGLDSHLDRVEKDKIPYIRHLLGIANHICFINPKDIQTKEHLDYLKEIWQSLQ